MVELFKQLEISIWETLIWPSKMASLKTTMQMKKAELYSFQQIIKLTLILAVLFLIQQ